MDVIGFADTESSHGSISEKGNKKQKSGGFQSMGLSFPVIKGVLKRGYKVPTPIQRKVNSQYSYNITTCRNLFSIITLRVFLLQWKVET